MVETTDNQAWYRDGLRFTCTQCGDCCTGAPGVVWVDDEEVAEIARLSGQSMGEVRLLHTRLVGGRLSLREFANGDCTFLDPRTRRCRVYEARPKQCRSWPFWASNLESPATWAQTERVCPGAGCGAFVSLAEIEAQARLIEI